MKKLFSPGEVANLLDIHVKTVRRYLRDGTLKGIKIGGSWKISEEELEKSVEQSIIDGVIDSEEISMKENEKVMKSLSISIKVKNHFDGNTYAQALMKIINSDDYSECTFKYHLKGKLAEFVVSGPTDYLNAIMSKVDEIDKELQ